MIFLTYIKLSIINKGYTKILLRNNMNISSSHDKSNSLSLYLNFNFQHHNQIREIITYSLHNVPWENGRRLGFYQG